MHHDYSSIGFITFDALAWPVTQIPPGADTYFIDDFTLAVSGTAVIAVAKMGLSSMAVGGVGRDLMGDWVLRRLADSSVDASCMQRIKAGRTSNSIVTTRPDGARPALHWRDATAKFYVDDAMIDKVIDARVVHIGGVRLMDRMDDSGRNGELLKRA